MNNSSNVNNGDNANSAAANNTNNNASNNNNINHHNNASHSQLSNNQYPEISRSHHPQPHGRGERDRDRERDRDAPPMHRQNWHGPPNRGPSAHSGGNYHYPSSQQQHRSNYGPSGQGECFQF